MKPRPISAWILLFLVSWTLGLAQDGGSGDGRRSMEIEDLLALKSLGSIAISPDGHWVAYVVTERDLEENVNNSDLWLVAVEAGKPVRLTYGPQSDNAPQWAPDSSWLAFRSSRGEKAAVWGISPRGGEAWQVTDHETPVGDFRISPDGQWIAFTANEKKSEEQEKIEKERGRPNVWDDYYPDQWTRLWLAPLHDRRSKKARKLASDGLQVSNAVFSPDAQQIAFGARPSPALRTYSQGAVYLIDTQEEEAQPRQATHMPGGATPVEWHPDHGLIVSSSAMEQGTHNRQLWHIPLPQGEPVSLTAALDENAGFVSATSDWLFVEAARKTLRGLYRIPVRQGRAVGDPVALTSGPLFRQGFSASRDGSRLAFSVESGNQSPEVYVASPSSMKERRLSSIHSGMEAFSLGEQRVVGWKSRADGEPIEGILTLPVGYRLGQPVPLLLIIHGGPAGVSSDRFSPSRGAYPLQVFAGRGYAVLQPNYRGSTGYGERFRGLNRGDISGRDWIDIDSGVDEMIRQGIADPQRLGIMGWSFGGHHTYWGITQTDRYKAASAGAGANDLISMYSQTDIPEFYHTYLGPKPWEDFDLYEERSAYRNVAKVTTPLLIQVGEKDERVPAEQSIQFYEALRSIGKAETQLVVYPGQPHGIRDPRLLRDLLTRNLEWFARWIPADVQGPKSNVQGRPEGIRQD